MIGSAVAARTRMPYNSRTHPEVAVARTARIELRAEPEREERIRYAAALSHQSVSAFVLDAAAQRADELIAESTVTVVSDEFFDTLVKALERPPKRNEALARRAKQPRRVTQH